MDNNFIRVRKSKIQGRGTFASKDFKKGDKVYSFNKGKIIKGKDLRSLPSKGKKYLDKIGKGQYEIIELPGRFVNHSCDSNVAEKNRVAYALRSIKKGEEVTINYDKVAYIEKPITCRCGSEKCRGLIRGKEN